jgi:hypothetical protein
VRERKKTSAFCHLGIIIAIALYPGFRKISSVLGGRPRLTAILMTLVGLENEITDTPMNALCRTIEINLRQLLGETDLPRRSGPRTAC